MDKLRCVEIVAQDEPGEDSFCLSRAATAGGTNGCHVASHLSDLAHKGGGNMPIGAGGRQEYRIEAGGEGAIHAGHLHFIVEIGGIAEAAQQGCRAVAARSVDDEIVEGHHLDGARVGKA